MSIPFRSLRFAWCAAIACACSHAAPPAAPAPQPAGAPAAGAPAPAAADQANMSGDWAVEITSQGQSPITGLLRLSPSGEGYNGNLQLDGYSKTFFVRSARVQGNHMVMTVEGTDGDARVEGNLRAPTRFEGLYTSRTINGRFAANRR